MTRSTVRVMLALALGASGLAACTSTTPPPAAGPASPGLAPTAMLMPGGSGCAGEIGRFQAVLQSDVNTGNVARSVYNRAEPDITRAQTACQLGQESQALSILAATKARFGYR